MGTSTSATRRELEQRLTLELDDTAAATEIVAHMDEGIIDALAERTHGDLHASPLLSYRPATIPDDRVDTLWVLAFGYRPVASATSPAEVGGTVPPMEAIEPGPTNEELAHQTAAFVARTPVPVIAQWEVAEVLHHLGISGVVSVEPDTAEDGSVVYLSTAGVVEKGLRLAAEADIVVGQAGVLAHADHAVRAIMTANDVGLRGAVPETVTLPTAYDAESGQAWTRSRTDFIAVDLMARALG